MPPFFQTGFRPFFLLGALLAVVAMPWWGLVVVGHAQAPGPLPALHWHVHEMVVGFAGAIVAGFLLTAAANWTKRITATGPALASLVSLWALGRIAMHVDVGLPSWVVALPDGAWLVGVSAAVGAPIVAARSWRNVGLAAVPLLLAVGHGVIVLAPAHAAWGWTLGLNAVVLALVIVSGRIVPLFTRNALGVELARYTGLERSAVLAASAMLALDALGQAELGGVAALMAGAFTLTRGLSWKPLRALRRPLLGVLHVGHLGIAAGLLGVGLSRLGAGIGTTGLHVLTVGAVALFCLAMMARVALGHTGRPLRSPALATAAFTILGVVAVVRAAAAIPELRAPALLVAAIGFATAFALYLAQYTRILVTPRADGKPG